MAGKTELFALFGTLPSFSLRLEAYPRSPWGVRGYNAVQEGPGESPRKV